MSSSDTSSVGSVAELSTSTPPAPASRRKGNKKVRTGCITCKIRKVKCDEAKPSCQRCVKTGRVCDGYPVLRPRASRFKSPSPTPALETADELRAFDHYKSRSAFLLGGITVAGEEFWGGLVIQLTVTEPAVRHAVLALSCLHEELCKGNEAGRLHLRNGFAFSEYGKAIAAVRSWDVTRRGPESAAIPLLVCVLFICIEFLMRYEAASQLHICQGRLILSRMEQVSLDSPSMEMIRKVLVPIYARLSLASYLFATRPEPIPVHLTTGNGCTPLTFESMSDARDMMFHLLDQGLRFTTSGKHAVYNPAADPWEVQRLKATQAHILAQLSQWNTAFTFLRTTIISETAMSKATQDLLYVFYHTATIWVGSALSPCETTYDDYVSSFAAVISHASSAIAATGSLQREDAVFTFETEYLAPIYWTAAKCRHPLLRRAALRLLEREEVKRRRENLWRARELIVIAAYIIEVEEGQEQSTYYDSLGDMYGIEGYWHHEEELRVPLTQPPSLEKPDTKFSQEELVDIGQGTSFDLPLRDAPRGPVPLVQDVKAARAITNIDPGRLQAPFGISEGSRIKNTLIGSAGADGVWITTFMDPEPGMTEWSVRKTFLKVQ
ncbi:uncharacterized protein F5Z01DRAFT_672085 [Emericellopsis atlantica]|uniref:Zn(2)-C6 fungal-type domain-containing protein n=1 Tax=Emericellopsis atlantica TaxID=2614577 RepID=A0A9P7ZR97_9HYPO|nr:uncharacterized protein F5Z01DRAFT_672085 [Emericellopsis atlantica]KAG9256853.1 hypothetical protein F5Z01DRAFT_672085 [Emericellopsis atlantica]